MAHPDAWRYADRAIEHAPAGLVGEDWDRYLRGEWVEVTSTWIAAIRFQSDDPEVGADGNFWVRVIRGGKEYGPHRVTFADAIALSHVDSKGKLVNLLWGGGSTGSLPPVPRPRAK
jgi:hypothetical protein